MGASQPVIAYYEAESDQPPGALLVDLPQALRVSADELPGLKAATEKPPPKTARLRRRLQLVDQLPTAHQRTVLKLLDALHAARLSAAGRSRRRVVGCDGDIAKSPVEGRAPRTGQNATTLQNTMSGSRSRWLSISSQNQRLERRRSVRAEVTPKTVAAEPAGEA